MPNKKTAKSTKDSTSNATRRLYYQSPAVERKVNLTTAIIVGAIALAAGLIVGLNWTPISSSLGRYLGGKNTADTIDFSSLNTIYQSLAENFDGNLEKSKLIEGAKRGMVEAAGDDYTYYMNETEASDFEKDLSGDVGAGIGVEIGSRDGFVKVLRTMPDNPARAAGVLAGDIIYKADDEDISGLSVDEVAKKLRGAEGTQVKLTVVRDNKEISFDLTRATINNVSAYIDYRGKTAIITLTRFDKDTGTLTRKLAREALDKGCDKFILDLRGNGGGYVTSARDVASIWIDGKVVVEQRSANGIYNEKTYATRGDAILAGKKTIVLVNGSTASASEIVAGALKDYNLATIIGEKTYGKGSVQSLESFLTGEMLRVTIAKWYTPNGKNIDKEGIEPDKVVERTFEQINKEEDPQLDAALNE
ncbi:S41 family peptidase [Candidatus Saccharibacteria bacterium]|nr:S41 family peptidase [Candidatus Saccharibacteria bacterium]MBR6961667.1 S41 family peptidase [Candidatus Saccharibacteria bacterium]